MTNSNSAASGLPTVHEILARLLLFFSSGAEEQLGELKKYEERCERDGTKAHIHDPLTELAEGLVQYGSVSTSEVPGGNSFCVPGLPPDVADLGHELASLVHMMLGSKEDFDGVSVGRDYLFSSEDALKNAPAWRLVRRLARVTLEAGQGSLPPSNMDLFGLLSMVAD